PRSAPRHPFQLAQERSRYPGRLPRSCGRMRLRNRFPRRDRIPCSGSFAPARETMKKIALRLAVLLGAGLAFHAAFSQPAAVRITPAPKAAGASGAQAKTQQPVLKGFPFTNESLSYTVNWPSGLSLGETHISATGTPTGWRFDFTLDAGIPGFAVKDSFESIATKDLCSETFHKNTSHGNRKGSETVTIDQAAGVATRTPANG